LSNLDALLRQQMRSELRRLQKEVGVTAVYVTHDQSEALALSDRIAVLYGGRIMGTVSIAEADPEHLGLLMAGIHPEAAPAHG